MPAIKSNKTSTTYDEKEIKNIFTQVFPRDRLDTFIRDWSTVKHWYGNKCGGPLAPPLLLTGISGKYSRFITIRTEHINQPELMIMEHRFSDLGEWRICRNFHLAWVITEINYIAGKMKINVSRVSNNKNSLY